MDLLENTDFITGIRLDSKRDHGAIYPPDRIMCAGGKWISLSDREERPLEWSDFVRKADAAGHVGVYKTRCYEQDGFSFEADGTIIEECLDDVARKKAQKMEAERGAERAAALAKAQYMADHGYAPLVSQPIPGPVQRPDMTYEVEAEHTKNANLFDLARWARGEGEMAHWFTIKAAMKSQYDFEPKNKKEAVDYLIRARVILADQAVNL